MALREERVLMFALCVSLHCCLTWGRSSSLCLTYKMAGGGGHDLRLLGPPYCIVED